MQSIPYFPLLINFCPYPWRCWVSCWGCARFNPSGVCAGWGFPWGENTALGSAWPCACSPGHCGAKNHSWHGNNKPFIKGTCQCWNKELSHGNRTPKAAGGGEMWINSRGFAASQAALDKQLLDEQVLKSSYEFFFLIFPLLTGLMWMLFLQNTLSCVFFFICQGMYLQKAALAAVISWLLWAPRRFFCVPRLPSGALQTLSRSLGVTQQIFIEIS